jgi:3D (Asp-Asp-Asp) domain-containing protein
MTNIITAVVITAYCNCTKCTHGDNITARGNAPREGITVAAPRAVPLGTKAAITVPGAFTNRIFVVEDRTARRFDGRWDIFIASHERAKRFGKQNGEIKIIK